jgi:hypothetical protein
MRASVGDQIVIASNRLDRPDRHGHIVEVPHADGTPPYVVEWDDGRRATFYPGPDAHVERAGAGHEGLPEAYPVSEPAPPRHVKTWTVRVDVFEEGDSTVAHAVLHGEAPTPLEEEGKAVRKPEDPPVPEIGDEVAVSRALRRLADRLMSTASGDLSDVSGRMVSLTH